MLPNQLIHKQESYVTKTTMILPKSKSNLITSSPKITLGILVQSLSYVLPKEYVILIVLLENSSTITSLRKKLHNVYNSGIKPIKLAQKNLRIWDILLEIGESEHEKNT